LTILKAIANESHARKYTDRGAIARLAAGHDAEYRRLVEAPARERPDGLRCDTSTATTWDHAVADLDGAVEANKE